MESSKPRSRPPAGRRRINRPAVGFVIGALAPVIGFFIVFALLRQGDSFDVFTSRLMGSHDLAAKVVSLSLLANAIPFVLFTNRRLDYAARGIFIATLLYAVFIVLLRFVWT